MGFLVWIWLSLIAVLVGAEIEAAIVGFGGMAAAQAGGPQMFDGQRLRAIGHD